nr:SDR family oxidoreductase [Leptospira ainazelensis]
MLGSAVFRGLSENSSFYVVGTNRSRENLRFFTKGEQERIQSGFDVLNNDDLLELFLKVKPDLVINCVGIIKQQKAAKDPLVVLPINSLLPHRLSNLCKLVGARLVLVSTDCVFNGKKGNYLEGDLPDAEDLYGKSKEIGEVLDENHVLTIRTSIIGHELDSSYSLVNWFLSQEVRVKGFKKAFFSGLPTCEMAEIFQNYIIPNAKLSGLYHVSSERISKFDLLNLIARIYDKKIQIDGSDDVVIDRSLDSAKFRNATFYSPKPWPDLILTMKKNKERYLDISNV